MIIFLSISCVIIQHCTADHASKAEKEGPDTWLVTAISIGASAILLLIMLLCCCCCSFCRQSKPNRNRFRRSSSFRFNRTSAPTAPIATEGNVEINEEGPHSSQISDANNILNDDNFSNATAPYPPPYTTLPSSGHRTIATSNESTNSMIQELSPTASSNIRLERSDTTVSEVWYDASTLER